MAPQEILTDIHALEEELLEFERKYGLRSETFYVAYAGGEEPENDAWSWTSANGRVFIGRGSPGRRNIGPKSSDSKEARPA